MSSSASNQHLHTLLDETMKRITICITDEQFNHIKQIMLQRPGVTQSVIMRELINRGLSHRPDFLTVEQHRENRKVRQHIKK